MCSQETFLINLYKYLTGKDGTDCNIIRKHTRKLEDLGDLSFPLNISNWHNLVNKNHLEDKSIETIFQYLSIDSGDVSLDTLTNASTLWPFRINKYLTIQNNVHIYLERSSAFCRIINEVHWQGENYGSCNVGIKSCVVVKCECDGDECCMNLTELRLTLLATVTRNLLKYCDVSVTTGAGGDAITTLCFALKSVSDSKDTFILCGPVLNDKGQKDFESSAEDFYKKRVIDMRLMAEHKYGLRVTSQVGWKEFFEKLGRAAVTIELLQNKPSHSTTININDHTLSSSKGASFILYNCARLAALFKEFDRKVCSNVYPQLPGIDTIDFGLLIQQEEWELLYVYILQFPAVVKNCVKDILKSKVNTHYLTSILSGMCITFSVYYRRIRILTEPRDYLFPVLHARIYLLKALEQVLHNGLRLLDIQPVKQM